MLRAASRSVSPARPDLKAIGILLVAIIGCALGQRGSAAQTDSAALLIYLPPGAMPRAVGGNGAIVVGGLRAGGGFYWMPTTGVVYIGGKEAIAVSRDGQTIVGTGINAARTHGSRRGNGCALPSGSSSDRSPRRRHHATRR